MASSGKTDSLSASLLCPVCFVQISRPKVIPCGHSLCLEPCLKNLLKSSSVCPLCHKKIHVSSGFGLADDFPTNFALQSLLGSGPVEATTQDANDEPSTCQTHDKESAYFCGTRSEFLCGECHSSHDQNHEIEEVSEVARRKISELTLVMNNIGRHLVTIRESMDSIKEAKSKCEVSSMQAKCEIHKATASVIDLVRRREKELYLEVATFKEANLETLRDLEVQNINLELIAKHAEGIGASLLNRFRKNNIHQVDSMDILMIQERKIKEELMSLNVKPVDVKAAVSFQLEVPSVSLGQVKGYKEEQKPLRPIQLECLGFTVTCVGFVWFALDHLLMIQCTDGGQLHFIAFNDNINTNIKDAYVDVKNLRTISPVLGKDGRSLLVNDPKKVLKITFDLSTGKSSSCKATIQNAMLYKIIAVTWDEKREGCYVLLNDKISICHLSFDQSGQGNQCVQLDS